MANYPSDPAMSPGNRRSGRPGPSSQSANRWLPPLDDSSRPHGHSYPPPPGRGADEKVTVTRAAAQRSREMGSKMYGLVHRAATADGADKSGLTALTWPVVANFAVDAAMAVALANTLFFAAASGESKSRVALYLLITIAPFAVIAPLIGPALDRLQHGRRPTAREMFMSGGLQKETLRRGFGSWFGLVSKMGDLDGREQEVMQRHAAFLSEVEQSRMERSYKMLVLEAMLEEGALPGVIRTDVLAARLERIAERSPFLRQELAATMRESAGTVAAMLRSNPLRAWTGTKRGEGSDFFEMNGDRFATKFGVGAGASAMGSGDRETLPVLTRELVEWRMAEYLARADLGDVEVVTSPSAGKELRVGASFMREEIPALLASKFSRSVWQQGIVAVPSGLALLVTLDKQGKIENQKYEDRFESPSLFQWQSQNQTSRDGKHGRLIHDHEALGKQIHLFVRKRGKRGNSTAAPFFYCGELVFDRWDGERPITVWWRLKTALSGELISMLMPARA